MGRFTNPVYLRQSSTHAIWALTTEKIQEKTNLEVAFNAFTPHLNPDRKLDDNEVGERWQDGTITEYQPCCFGVVKNPVAEEM